MSPTPIDRTYIEIQIETTPEAAEVLAGELAEQTGGVEVRDGETYVRAPGGRNTVVAHVEPQERDDLMAGVLALLDGLRDAGTAVDPVVVREREANEGEWRDKWKQFFRATRIGRTFIVRPSWDPGQIESSDKVIDLDPGRAFGTGAHASTRLCLDAIELLEERGLQPRRFLDAGCGSGILSIAALRVWPAARGVCCDVDPEAVETARENAALNHAFEALDFVVGDAEAAGAGFDLVLANIQLEVHERIAAPLAAAVAPGGALALSGLLEGQDEPAARAYTAQGLVVTATLTAPEWCAVVLVCPGASPSAPGRLKGP